MNGLWWLPDDSGWKDRLKEARSGGTWASLMALANARLDFVRTNQLDRRLTEFGAQGIPEDRLFAPIRFAVLASCTVDQLLPSLRVAALRRGLWLTAYRSEYGQYQQELMSVGSELHRFKPNVVLFSFDARHLLGNGLLQEPEHTVNLAVERIVGLWRQARGQFECQVIQQTLLPTFVPLMGNNEQRLPASPNWLLAQINTRLRECADAEGVDILALDDRAARDGIGAWHSAPLWHSAKQDISPGAAPLWGDLALRLVAARRGLSAKCLVLDLDNTLWGGAVGDDGVEGIVLGQGSAAGEAFLHFQNYAKGLSQRGIILAVCSKNDEKNALAPFASHPDMVLKTSDIACFVANWNDKPSNLQSIANQLNIGLDSLVFVDDNPFERNMVRQALPIVMVPELPEDPALFSQCVADSGYFEAVTLTPEDLGRTQNYQSNKAREQLRESAADPAGYLKSLEMKLIWKPFDAIGLQRITQLINKTNQFNLTTRRYTEAEVAAILEPGNTLALQLRLVDKFGDHGVIGVVIARPAEADVLDIETWLMSCRVFGRGVEDATANLLVREAKKRGGQYLVGHYRPTQKNRMVKDHYLALGFKNTGRQQDDGTDWCLALETYVPKSTFLDIIDETTVEGGK